MSIAKQVQILSEQFARLRLANSCEQDSDIRISEVPKMFNKRESMINKVAIVNKSLDIEMSELISIKNPKVLKDGEEIVMRNDEFYSTSEDTDNYTEYEDSLEDLSVSSEEDIKDLDMNDNFIEDEMQRIQSSSRLSINKDDFKRVCEALVKEFATDEELHMDDEAYEAVQTAAEHFMVEMFERVNEMNEHYGKDTVEPTDLKMYMKMYMKIHKKNIYI